VANSFYVSGLQNMIATNVNYVAPNGSDISVRWSNNSDAADVTFTASTGANVSMFAILAEEYKSHVVKAYTTRVILLDEIYRDYPKSDFRIGTDHAGKMTAWLTEQLLGGAFLHARALQKRAKAAGLNYRMRELAAAGDAMGFTTAGSKWMRLPKEHPWRL